MYIYAFSMNKINVKFDMHYSNVYTNSQHIAYTIIDLDCDVAIQSF